MTTRRLDVSPPGFSDDDSAPASNLSSMQRAIVTIQKMRAKIESLERMRTEPIAIIGMACRIPGGANTPEAFFQLLEDGIDTVTEVPPERWRIEPEGPNSEGDARALRWGAFLKGVDRFDAAFFGISPREAESLDPQHRLLLEVTWEALERAGQLPERLMGTKAGVFVGIWAPDYQQRVLARDPSELDAYCFTGTVLSTAAGRLSYTLGLQGPCMSIDTACSSSLTAIHLACQSLRSGESTMAIAGGVNLMLAPTTTKLLSKTQALSPDGRCKTFDARANGYVRGEGCGMLVLKRLGDAERDGDTILALIRGSAVNQDGKSTGLTAPNVLSQQALLRQALENARLAPQDISYLETHGTGTSLGDPIEVEAIKAVLGAQREKGATCVLGAVKSNIGHLEAAAGVAGLIKVVLALHNEKIPGNLHFRSLNPRIDLGGTCLEIAQTANAWPSGIRPRYAGISSFGISGTNAHVIVEEAPPTVEEALLEEEAATCLLPISAKTPEALRAHAEAYCGILKSQQSLRFVDIVHTASGRRSHYVHRLAIVGATKEEVAEQLDAYLQGNAPSGIVHGKATPARAKIVFVFSGQGSQWLGMGRQLYDTDSSFRSVIDTCDNLMTSRLGWSLLDELDAPEAMSRMSETQVAQPLLFALQVALVEMLRSWGISPDAMIGHSVGEIAAAHVAGILSLDEAIRLVSLRGRIMQKATGMGKMVSIAMSPEDAKAVVAGYEDRVSIAAINDPGSVVLSGQTSALEDVVVRCEKRGFVCRALRVDYAFHSPQMDVFERELVERLARVDTRRATLAMYSTVLADCVDGKELDVRYWGRNIRCTVDFAGAVFAAIRDGYQLFLEVGPHPDLVDNTQRCLLAKKAEGYVVGTLQRGHGDRRALLETAGGLYTRGCAIEWSRVVPSGGHCIPLPTYPWQHERFWVDLPNAELALSNGAHPTLATAHAHQKVVFVFPGQGSQWLGMGRQLFAEEEAFRVTLETCDAAIRREADFSVLDELNADELTSRLDEIDVVQPVLFAFEVALAALWRSKGVEPDCVVGHSMGEVAAAHVAGMLTLQDAVKVICRRSRLLKRIRGQGAMAQVELSLTEAEAAIATQKTKLAVAASNGPRSTVLSGDPTALKCVLEHLAEKGILGRPIKVDVASHSPHVDPLIQTLLDALKDLRPTQAAPRMRSTVTTSFIRADELGASYWVQNLRAPVRFSQTIGALIDEGYTTFVEISPHPILLPSIEENLHDRQRKGVALPTLRRKSDELQSLGASQQVLQQLKACPNASKDESHRHRVGDKSPMLGTKFQPFLQPSAHYWQTSLRIDDLPWLRDHRIHGSIVFPASGYLEVALEAFSQLNDNPEASLEDISFDEMLRLMSDEPRLLQVAVVSNQATGTTSIRIASTESGGQWVQHAHVRTVRHGTAIESRSLHSIEHRCANIVDPKHHYAQAVARGLQYDRDFKGIHRLSVGDGEALAYVNTPCNTLIGSYRAYPPLLDACFQVGLALIPGAPDQTYVPVSIRRVTLVQKLSQEAWVHVRLTNISSAENPRFLDFDILVMDREGCPHLEVQGIRFQAIEIHRANDPLDECAFGVEWRKANLPHLVGSRRTAGAWLIFVNRSGAGSAFADAMRKYGEQCIEITHDKQCKQIDASSYLVDTTSLQALRHLLENALGKQSTCAGVVFFNKSRLEQWPEPTAESLEKELLTGTFPTVRIAQAMLRHRWRTVPRLWIVTREAQVVSTTDRPAVMQAPIWGVARTIAMEHPELECTRIDLPREWTANIIEELTREVISRNAEDQVALRPTGRFVARLVRKSIASKSVHSVLEDATYLITGGLGALGLSLTRWLVAHGARHVALLSRTAPNAEANALIAEQSKLGVDIRAYQGDISRREDVERIVSHISATMPNLRGIVHAAGILDDRTILALEEDQFLEPMRAKIFGAVFLQEYTKSLDFFIAYSSVAGVLGLPGQCSYAGANTFLDAFCWALVADGRPATSIQWGTFSTVGLAAARQDRGERLAGRGLGALSPDEGLCLMGRILARPLPEITFMRFSLRQWFESYPQAAALPFLSNLSENEEAPGSKSGKVEQALFARALMAMPADLRVGVLEQHIRELLGQVLRKAPSRISVDEPFAAMGVDSLMSLELRNRLESALGVELRATLLYTYTNTAALAAHLMRDKLSALSPHVAASSPNGPNHYATDGNANNATFEKAHENPFTESDDEDLLAAFDASVHDIRKDQ